VWKNNQLRQKIIVSKVPVPVVVDPNAPPEVASVIKNDKKLRAHVFERKFLKDIREMREGRKERDIMIQRYLIYQEKRKILLELIRRLRLASRSAKEHGDEREIVGINYSLDIANLSDAELERRLSEYDLKNRLFKAA
jgi:hypothetical protein